MATVFDCTHFKSDGGVLWSRCRRLTFSRRHPLAHGECSRTVLSVPLQQLVWNRRENKPPVSQKYVTSPVSVNPDEVCPVPKRVVWTGAEHRGVYPTHSPEKFTPRWEMALRSCSVTGHSESWDYTDSRCTFASFLIRNLRCATAFLSRLYSAAFIFSVLKWGTVYAAWIGTFGGGGGGPNQINYKF